METVQQRVAFLEGRVTEYSHVIDSVQQGIADLKERFNTVDQRFIGIDQRLATFDQRFLSIEERMSRQFYWILGVQMTTFVATIATILAAMLSR